MWMMENMWHPSQLIFKKNFDAMAEKALADITIKTNPRSVSHEEIVSIFEKCFKIIICLL